MSTANSPTNQGSAGEEEKDTFVTPKKPRREISECNGVRINKFWTKNPKVWFTQLESEFVLSRITSDITKYQTVLRHLNHQILATITDFLDYPPAENRYEALKNLLINRFSESVTKQTQKLLTDLELNRRKPSELLRKMKRLTSGSDVSERILQTLWKQRLPRRVQELLTVTEGMEIEKQADFADRLMEQNESQITQIATEPRNAYLSGNF
ncbi:uncharacterized protein LOC128885607 [Hylaeus anthracinus]|uniref:uncharacterized protein LOC128885607 n=1 Tax=Hylaeus anthracinus TaxID=313031 RepID=UPI0023B8A74E|nr:uncharacterized protein LOC128885607 [Hylaeus anthracinus]